MKIVLVKTLVGTFLGEPIIDTQETLLGINLPCMIEFVPVPVQSRVGQTTMAIGRLLTPWPCETLFLHNTSNIPMVLSWFDSDMDTKVELVKDYLRARKEAWERPSIINA